MRFSDLELDKMNFEMDFLKGEDQGRRRISIAMDKLDQSWDMIVRTTASVMGVMFAEVRPEDQQVARTLIAGMLGLAEVMSNVWCMKVGGMFCDPPDMDITAQEALEVDEAGRALAAKVDLFGGAIMVQLLASIPQIWSEHYKRMAEACISLQDELDQADSVYLARLITAEQAKLTRELIEMIDELMVDGSVRLKYAQEWVEKARGVFSTVLAMGCTSTQQVMTQVILQCGFPDVCKED
jgi:hypothetical protein